MEYEFENGFSEGSGRKSNQRMKAFLVLQFLLRNSDEAHPVKIDEITAYLQEDCGIAAERRSIYRDIKEINIAHVMLRSECSFEEAEEMLFDDDDLALIQSKHLKGFYICDQNRSIVPDDIRLLAECVYSAKFIPDSFKNNYVDQICQSLSKFQEKQIKHDVFSLGSISTLNRETINNIDTIKDALPPHEPKKLRFIYLKYTLQNAAPRLTDRRHGREYIVSPYAMLIDNGYYYLLAIDDKVKTKRLTTYRIDRMRLIEILPEPRTVTAEAEALDLQDYTRRVFSMIGGNRQRVTIRFVNSLLDAMVDRFGTQDVIYSQLDETHITITATVEISDQFYGWLCGFRHMVKITSPQSVVDDFAEYVKSISDWYHS